MRECSKLCVADGYFSYMTYGALAAFENVKIFQSVCVVGRLVNTHAHRDCVVLPPVCHTRLHLNKCEHSKHAASEWPLRRLCLCPVGDFSPASDHGGSE